MKRFFETTRKKLAIFRGKKRLQIVLCAVGCVLVPFLLLIVSEFVDRLPFGEILPYLFEYPGRMLMGLIPLVLLFALLTLASRRPWVAALVLGVANVLLRYASYYKTQYLGAPVTLADFNLAGDALSISSEYPIPLYAEVWLGFLFTGLIVVLLAPLRLPKRKTRRRELFFRVVACVVAAALFVGYFAGVIYNRQARDGFGYSVEAQVSREYNLNYFYTAFFVHSESAFPKKPVGYSSAALAEIAEELQEIEVETQTSPDVIVVLAESWSFLEEYEGVTFDVSLRSNYDRIAQEAATGWMVSSQYGNGTAQIEFEVLTGFSTDSDILPLNAYNTYTYAGMASISNYQKSKNYATIAVHPYTFELYNRPTVYENLGIDALYDKTSIENPYAYGLFVADDVAVKKAIEVYEQATAGEAPVFLQLITMQNHGPFAAEMLTDEQRMVSITGGAEALSPEEKLIFENVASQMYMTDAAIGQLIDYFKTVDRDVVVVVYGDHQARVTPLIDGEPQSQTLLEILGFYEDNDEQQAAVKTHLTPYLMWSNYQAASTPTFGYLAPNQLLPYALHEFSAARPAYFEWLYQQSAASDVRGRSGDFIIYADNSVVYGVDDAALEALSRRNILEYDVVLKKGDSLGDFIW